MYLSYNIVTILQTLLRSPNINQVTSFSPTKAAQTSIQKLVVGKDPEGVVCLTAEGRFDIEGDWVLQGTLVS